MKKYIILILVLICFPIFSQNQFEEISFNELLNHHLFEGNKDSIGMTYFSVLKLETIFTWPGNIKLIDDEIIEQIM